MKIFLAPGLLRNIKKSIIDGVTIDSIDIRDPELMDKLSKEYLENIIRLWAFKETLRSIWKSMSEGDFVLFYNSGKFMYAGKVYFKYPFKEETDQIEKANYLSESVWGRDVDGSTWTYIVFLKDIREINLTLSEFNNLTGYNLTSIRKSMKVREEKSPGLMNWLQQLYLKSPEKPKIKPGIKKMETVEIEHDEIVDLLFALGELIGYKPERKWRHKGYEFDVVWFKPPREGPKHVFEVHLKGNLEAALLRLKHAYDLWESQIFLISTEDKLKEAQTKFLGELHELKDKIVLVNIESIEEFYNFKGKYEWLERKFGLKPS